MGGDARRVWSSDGATSDDDARKRPGTKAKKPKPSPSRADDGVVRVHRETKGRKGAGVTVVTGLAQTGDDLKRLAKAIKQRCGSGGTVKPGRIEIQGEHRDAVVAFLATRGIEAKRAGG